MRKIKQFIKENKWFLIIILVTWPLLVLLIYLLIGLLLNFIKHDLTINSGPWIWIKESVALIKVWPIIIATLFIYWIIIWKWFKHKPLKPHTKEVVNDDYGNANYAVNGSATQYNDLPGEAVNSSSKAYCNVALKASKRNRTARFNTKENYRRMKQVKYDHRHRVASAKSKFKGTRGG